MTPLSSLSIALLLGSTQAEDLTQVISGHYVLNTTIEALDKERKKALKATLNDMNFIYRQVAGGRLEGKPNACSTYTIELTTQDFSVQCDTLPPITLKLDQTPSSYTSAEGDTFVATASINGNIVTLFFEGENVSQLVTYTFSNGLTVLKELQSEYFPTPLRLSIPYKVKPTAP